MSAPAEVTDNDRPAVHWFSPVPGPVPGTKHVTTLAFGPKYADVAVMAVSWVRRSVPST